VRGLLILLLSQRDQGIHADRAACGDVAGDERGGAHHRRHGEERAGVGGAAAEEQAATEEGRKDQRGFELVLEPPAPGRAAEFDVSFEVKPR